MTGAVVWITGVPASGKSTLARAVQARLPSAILDGDALRPILAPGAGHDEAARDDFYRRLAELAALLAGQGLVVLVPATAHRRRHRDLARRLAPRFVEVHVATRVEEAARRDPKGLWARAHAGLVTELPGAGVEYEPPLAPDVIAAGGEDEAAVAAIARLVSQTRSS